MSNKSINPILLIGFIGFFTIGSAFMSNLLSAFYGDKNIYWTNNAMKLPIEETKNNFEIFISGKILQQHLLDKTLYSVDKNGAKYLVVSEDISARINNWEKIRSHKLIMAAIMGVAFGVTLTLLILGIVQTFSKMNNKDT